MRKYSQPHDAKLEKQENFRNGGDSEQIATQMTVSPSFHLLLISTGKNFEKVVHCYVSTSSYNDHSFQELKQRFENESAIKMLQTLLSTTFFFLRRRHVIFPGKDCYSVTDKN